MAQLVDLARAPRPLGSPEHARVHDHLIDRLRRLGLEIVDTPSTPLAHAAADGDVLDVATPRPDVARLPGTASTG